ncbi:hypothetical protein D9758_012767 [Tetrapyrgos nigripes]|uniref:FAS1 domain-containing protein n=1 Tax=Tetrapyrgos nigripes TaxID=182062 RepID=A0A8H5CSU6_9AGAR|nr:hypothetical protein D9758_012767 [Tetrapyrgos nigripes]
MRLPTLSLLAGAAVLPLSLAQSLDANAIIQALRSAGLNSLAEAATSINSTEIGISLFTALLSGQNVTVFAPTDQAFSNAQSRLGGASTNDVAEVLAYHVLLGNYSSPTTANTIISSTSPNVTIARTFLNASDEVRLEGNKSQVLAWTRQGDAVTFINQNTTTTVQNVTHVSNITLAVIDQVLAIPRDIHSVIESNSNLSAIEPVFGTQTTGPNGDNQALIDVLEDQRGITIFVPNNDAVIQANATLLQLAQNTTALLSVLGNHIINGTSVYSPSITDGAKLTSSRGEELSFTVNATGVFVTSGNATAQIVQTDLLTENGVLHIINGVLTNAESDEQKAGDA